MSVSALRPCNFSGFYDFDVFPALGRFGVVDYDWSNAKQHWDNQDPMTCQSSLAEQAAKNKAVNPRAKIFVCVSAINPSLHPR